MVYILIIFKIKNLVTSFQNMGQKNFNYTYFHNIIKHPHIDKSKDLCSHITTKSPKTTFKICHKQTLCIQGGKRELQNDTKNARN